MKGEAELARLLCKLSFDGCECGVENMAACQDPPCACREFARLLVKAGCRAPPKTAEELNEIVYEWRAMCIAYSTTGE